MAAPKKQKFKQMIRTISKSGMVNPADGLFTNEMVEAEVNDWLENGYQLIYVQYIASVGYMDNQNAGVEMLYVFTLKE